MTHFQATVPLMVSERVIVTNYVLESVAPSPLSFAASFIPSHGIARGKVVPRTNELDGLNGRVCLTEIGASA